MNRYDRLRRLEGDGDENKEDAEIRREEIRRSAEHANNTRKSAEPAFAVLSGGEVYCTFDGRRVTHPHQIAAETFYLHELSLGHPGLIHDPKREAFLTQDGELALTRNQVNLERLLGPKRMEAWKAEEEGE